jgi:hypothetical protein
MLDGGKLVLGRKRNMNNSSNGLFSSVVSEVLEEELGISKEVHDEALKMYYFIGALLLTNTEYGYYFVDNTKVYGIHKEGSIKIFKDDYFLNYSIEFIFVENQDAIDELRNRIFLEQLGYSQGSNTLVIRMPIITSENFNPETDVVQLDDNVDADIYNTLQHEFKHIYQKYMISLKDKERKLMNFKEREVYQKAVNWIYTNGYNNSDKAKIFWAIYVSSPVEITANIQSVYGSIKRQARNRNDAMTILNSSEFMEEMDLCSGILNKLINNRVSLFDQMHVQQKLGRDVKWITKYINRGLNRMKQSVRKLEKLIDKEYLQ